MNIRPMRSRKNESRSAQEKAGAPKKKRRLKYIAILPSVITLMNGACGFISIIAASRSPELRWSFLRRANMNSFVFAGCMIFLAMVADMLDGRVARLTRTTSSFGGQLDSLSDAISFGVAPAFLMFKLVEFHSRHLGIDYLHLSGLIERGIFFSALFYAMCAVVRLARFNAENDEDESAHMNFSGLPSPAAAGVVASLIICHQQLVFEITANDSKFFQVFEIVTISVLPVITLLSGLLMVSRIRYPHLTNQLLRSKKGLPALLAIFACVFFIVWKIHLAAVAGFCGFAIVGVLRWIAGSISQKPPPAENPPAV